MIHVLTYLFKMSITKRPQPSKMREKQSCLSQENFEGRNLLKTCRTGVTQSLNYLRFRLGLAMTLMGGQILVGLTASDCGCLRKNKFGSAMLKS